MFLAQCEREGRRQKSEDPDSIDKKDTHNCQVRVKCLTISPKNGAIFSPVPANIALMQR